ncbi:MAG: UDP-N-acetylglucosamine--N-acetylmuramyl-(pentapeptide) pyrophosphoryl-undecaprenol N-acetylglucosamine transferase [Rickettsiales bacterium]|jgi:UDP-N-acetylglucosamine--N-acetylmuramyl-(pentapeptide) pyrophosphoryl-undecaprenol N-acetylglucosamine transferase|nr:UDP-N-acetylglucosamine--N-acetylmuramyl-(pentapeptide) pyrophosphoryl-undecaprenol N-acetylglucosamine transferase [Rickettsiales bacterium]
MEEKKVIIASGGTGGHINPAVAVAKYLNKKNYKVLVVGNDKIEKYLKDGKIEYKIIESGSSLTRPKSVLNILKGIFQSLKIVFDFKPSVVIGFGSYATLPVLIVCKLKRVPILLHEGNSFIGRINKLFLGGARYLFTSFQEIYGMNIKYSNKIHFTGIPMRSEVKELYDNIYTYPKEGEKLTILITGGSGGASFFSNRFLDTFQYIDEKIRKTMRIFHQVKEKDEVEKVKLFYDKLNIESDVRTFFDDLPGKILESHLVICRSGAGTISEISVVGRPVIFFPSPNVVNNHQMYNAKFFERNGAGIILEEALFVPIDFARTLVSIIDNKTKLIQMAEKVKSMANLDAEKEIEKIVAGLCEEV